MKPSPLSDCCGAPPEDGVSGYMGLGTCSRCHHAAVFPEALGRCDLDRDGNTWAGVFWSLCFTAVLVLVIAYPVLPGWAVGLAAIVAVVFGLGGWRLNERKVS